MRIGARTDIGKVRPTNDDAYTYKVKNDNNFIAFVCDGMGGHQGGYIAAKSVIDTINESYDNLKITKSTSIESWLYETIKQANAKVYNQAISSKEFKGMGTTITGFISCNGKFYYAHVGDSRLYVYDDSKFMQITDDHTYVNSLYKSGLISKKEMANHPKRHVLTNAIGVKETVRIDIDEFKLKEKENIFICTDGLYNSFAENYLFNMLDSNKDIEDKCNFILSEALRLDGKDNITFVLVERNG